MAARGPAESRGWRAAPAPARPPVAVLCYSGLLPAAKAGGAAGRSWAGRTGECPGLRTEVDFREGDACTLKRKDRKPILSGLRGFLTPDYKRRTFLKPNHCSERGPRVTWTPRHPGLSHRRVTRGGVSAGARAGPHPKPQHGILLPSTRNRLGSE